MKKDSELKARGYSVYRTFADTLRPAALNCAAGQRVSGNNAQVVEYSSMVRGYSSYAVWVRPKGFPNYLRIAQTLLTHGTVYSMEEMREKGIHWGAVRALLEIGVLQFISRNHYSLKGERHADNHQD